MEEVGGGKGEERRGKERTGREKRQKEEKRKKEKRGKEGKRENYSYSFSLSFPPCNQTADSLITIPEVAAPRAQLSTAGNSG